jgi:2-oxo-3-hexenedioate decarboxylase
METAVLEDIARRTLASLGTSQTLERPTDLYPGFELEDGYRVAHILNEKRVARGERQLGRKIGGTNRSILKLIGATGPSWGFMYDTAMGALAGGTGDFAVGAFPLSRIEPEIAFRIGRAPQPGMNEAEVLNCIDQVTHGFEFVFSPYGDWKVPMADAVCAFGFHQGFVAGPWIDIADTREEWRELLKAFSIVLTGSSGAERSGSGSNALGSPVLALQALVNDIGGQPWKMPLRPGEIITTGTLTELMPAVAGESWSTSIESAPLAGLSVRLV